LDRYVLGPMLFKAYGSIPYTNLRYRENIVAWYWGELFDAI